MANIAVGENDIIGMLGVTVLLNNSPATKPTRVKLTNKFGYSYTHTNFSAMIIPDVITWGGVSA